MSVDLEARAARDRVDLAQARQTVNESRRLVAQLTRENEALHGLLADAATVLHEIATATDGKRCLRPIGEAASECLERISAGGSDVAA